MTPHESSMNQSKVFTLDVGGITSPTDSQTYTNANSSAIPTPIT